MTALLPEATVAYEALAPLTQGRLHLDHARRAFALVTWSCVVEPGDAIAARLIALRGPEGALADVEAHGAGSSAGRARGNGVEMLCEDLGLTPKQWKDAIGRWQPRLDHSAVRECLRASRRAGVTLILPDDPAWPSALGDLGEHAPVCLWARGDAGVLSRLAPAVAIVGARAATGYGEHIAMELSAELAGRGVSIVSGAAYGIDGAAHRAALRAGGVTVAFLAGGLDRFYPAGHSDLLRQIAASGIVLSEAPCGAAPTKWRFLQRNRLIAALADATLVVEAGWRSGSINTAGHAASLARPLGAVPGPVTSAASAGCHRLLREYDARCVTNADDVMELLGLDARGRGHDSAALFGPNQPMQPTGRTDDTTRVTDALSSRSWRSTDDLARRSGIARDEVAAILGLLALEGLVDRGEAGWRRVSAHDIRS